MSSKRLTYTQRSKTFYSHLCALYNHVLGVVVFSTIMRTDWCFIALCDLLTVYERFVEFSEIPTKVCTHSFQMGRVIFEMTFSGKSLLDARKIRNSGVSEFSQRNVVIVSIRSSVLSAQSGTVYVYAGPAGQSFDFSAYILQIFLPSSASPTFPQSFDSNW